MPAASSTSIEVHATHGIVVVKRSTDPAGLERLRREATVLDAARHPGVVDLVERRSDDGHPVVMTRWVGPLSLAATGRLPIDQVAATVAALSETVADLHELGLVHRNLRSEHVLLATDGRPVLCGFGGATFVAHRSHRASAPADDVRALGQLLARARRRRRARADPRPEAVVAAPTVDRLSGTLLAHPGRPGHRRRRAEHRHRPGAGRRHPRHRARCSLRAHGGRATDRSPRRADRSCAPRPRAGAGAHRTRLTRRAARTGAHRCRAAGGAGRRPRSPRAHGGHHATRSSAIGRAPSAAPDTAHPPSAGAAAGGGGCGARRRPRRRPSAASTTRRSATLSGVPACPSHRALRRSPRSPRPRSPNRHRRPLRTLIGPAARSQGSPPTSTATAAPTRCR